MALKGYENEKIATSLLYVCDHRNRLTRRMTTPFVSADTLGPKQVSQSHQMHQEANKKIFRALSSQPCHFLNSTFGCQTCDF